MKLTSAQYRGQKCEGRETQGQNYGENSASTAAVALLQILPLPWPLDSSGAEVLYVGRRGAAAGPWLNEGELSARTLDILSLFAAHARVEAIRIRSANLGKALHRVVAGGLVVFRHSRGVVRDEVEKNILATRGQQPAELVSVLLERVDVLDENVFYHHAGLMQASTP